MLTQQRTSVLKKKGAGAHGQFQNMHLAVYPFELEFLKNVDFKTAFYFQKDYQIIGEVSSDVPPARKAARLPLDSPKNIIPFRLFSQDNVVYKWSVYRRFDSGEEQFLESVTLNLKEIVTNFIIPQSSPGSRSNQSLINLTHTHKEVRCKFSDKLGIILNFVLYVSDDPNSIREKIMRRYLRLGSEIEQPEPPRSHLLKTQVTEAPAKGSQLAGSAHSNNPERSAFEMPSGSIVLLKNQSKEHLTDQEKAVTSERADLDDLILNDPAATEIQGTRLKVAEEEFEKIARELSEERREVQQERDGKKAAGEGLFEGSTENTTEGTNEEGLKRRDYTILKLESDQGRINQSPLDRKLEQQELAVIEEEKRSNKDTLSPHQFKPSKKTSENHNPNPSHGQIRVRPPIETQSSIKQPREEISFIQSPNLNLKKVLMLLVGAVLLFIAAATVRKNFMTTKKLKPRRK